jgi:lysophospholipase L1-like esterase
MKNTSSNKKHHSLPKALVVNLPLSVLSALFFIALIELFLILFHPIKKYGVEQGLLTAQPNYEYGFTPGFTGYHNSQDFNSSIHINNLGLNDYETTTYTSDQKTILVVGDSAFEGYGLDKYDSVPKALERFLEPDSFRVVNASVRGWSTRQIAGFLKEEGHKYSPQYIFVVFTENDLWENQHPTAIYKGFPFAHPLSSKNKFLANTFLLTRQSHFFRWLYYEMYTNKKVTDFSQVNKRMLKAANNNKYWKDFEIKLQAIHHQSNQLNSQLVFILQPWLKSYQADNNYTNSAGPLTINEKVKELLAKNNLDYIDLAEDIKQAQKEKPLYFTYSDGHLNKDGSYVVAQALAQKFTLWLTNKANENNL